MHNRESWFTKKLTKHVVQNIFHYSGNNNALSKFSEFYFTIFHSESASEIYKGNSIKYKGKYRSEGVFTPLEYLYRWFGIVGLIPEVNTLLLTPITPYLHNVILCMSLLNFCDICHIWSVAYDIGQILTYWPVFSYIWLSHVICHICFTWYKWHNDIHHMALCTYGVMGVKRTVRTSGMQSTIPNRLYKYV